jgi:hypothetical protein
MKSHVAAAGSVALLLGALTVLDRPASLDAAWSAPLALRLTSRPAPARDLPSPCEHRDRAQHRTRVPEPIARHSRSRLIAPDALTGVVKKTCAGCHSEQRKLGNLSLANFDLLTVANTSPDIAEKMIGKLRTGMMPPPGRAKPGGDTLDVLMTTLERIMDASAARNPNPGNRTFQRLNRAEYTRSVRELLSIDINADSWLPLDTKSANFDNIADVQLPSATTLDAYLDAASDIARWRSAIRGQRVDLTFKIRDWRHRSRRSTGRRAARAAGSP